MKEDVFKVKERIDAAKNIEQEGRSVKHEQIKEIIKDMDSIKKIKKSTNELKKSILDETVIKAKLKHEKIRQEKI